MPEKLDIEEKAYLLEDLNHHSTLFMQADN